MIEYHALDGQNPDFSELVDDLLTTTWKAQASSGYDGAIRRTVDSVVLDHLIMLAADEHTPPEVRAVASLKLDELKKWLVTQAPAAKDETVRAQFFFAESQIDHFEKNPADVHITAAVPPPDGDPIGSDDWE